MSSTQLIPVRAVTPTVVPQNDVIVYAPLASRTAHGIVKIGEGLNISSSGLLSLDRSEITVLKIAKNGVDIEPDENKRVNIVLNKTDVGLNNVDNTADINKPVSTAVRAAITVVDDKITNHMTDYNNPHNVTKSQVGLDKADNTSDLDKPVSNATQTALNAMKSTIDSDVLSLNNRVNDLSALLKLQDQAISFTTYGAVVSEFNSAATNKYHVGQTVFVNTQNVPDLWVYSVENTHIDYAYIGDADIIEQLEETGTVQFGYYKLAAMESQKVNLEGVVNLDEMQTITGLKLFKDQIGITNSANGDINYIKHINNNFLISASNGENIINIDEQLKTINFYNKPLALQEYADDNFISYTVVQELTDEQKEIARNNIGAGTGNDSDDVERHLKDINVNEISKEFVVGYSADELSNNHSWVMATSPSGFDQRQRACAYGNGYYVIAGMGGQMVYSKDAITWSVIPSFTTSVITGLAYGNGYFLAVDSDGHIYRSDLPTSQWALVYTNPIIIESIRYVNNKYYAVGENGFIAYSFDGASWKSVETGTTSTFIDIGYGNGKYVAVGQAGTVFTSINGETWYDKTIEGYTTDIRAIMYANGQFVIGTSGGRIDYSEDGEHWTQANNPSSLSVNWIRNFTYYANRLYAVMYVSTGQGEIWVSKDKGKTWSVEFTPTGTSRLWCITSGNDKFIASGDNGYIYTLDLNLSWKNQPTNAEYEWYRFKISQNDGSIVYSDVYYNDAATKQMLSNTVGSVEAWLVNLNTGSGV